MIQVLGIPITKPISVRCDNTSAINISKNPVLHSRTTIATASVSATAYATLLLLHHVDNNENPNHASCNPAQQSPPLELLATHMQKLGTLLPLLHVTILLPL